MYAQTLKGPLSAYLKAKQKHDQDTTGSVLPDKAADELIYKKETLRAAWSSIQDSYNDIGIIDRRLPTVVLWVLWIGMVVYLTLQPLAWPFNTMPPIVSSIVLILENVFVLGLYTASTAQNAFAEKNSSFQTVSDIEKRAFLSVLSVYYDAILLTDKDDKDDKKDYFDKGRKVEKTEIVETRTWKSNENDEQALTRVLI